MASFHYKAYGPNGDPIDGLIEAADRDMALKAVRRLGHNPFHLAESSSANRSFGFTDLKTAFVRKIDYSRLFADLEVLLTASFTIDRAVHTLLLEARASHERAALKEVHERLLSGKPLATAFAAIQGLTPSVLALLESAESSGRIDKVITSLAKTYREAAQSRGAVLQAVAYPVFLLCSMIAAFLVILFSLVPAIAPVFENTNVEKNGVVSALIWLHGMVSSNADIIAATVALFLAAGVWLAWSQKGRAVALAAALRLPGIGSVIKDRTNARYIETLAMLLGNGVGMRKAMHLSVDACPIPSFRASLEEMSNRVVSGGTFKDAANTSQLFDATTLALIAVGDDASRLPQTLERAAELLFARSNQKLERAVAMLSPIMTIAMGVMIGGLVLSIMSALIGINDMAFQ